MRSPFARPIHVALATALAFSTYAGVAAADARTESTAKAALRKAEDDFLRQSYAEGYARLEKALKACGTKKCGAGTRATLLRDMGSLAFRKGEKDRAAKYFADALALSPDLSLNPNYDAADMRQAFAAAKRGGGRGGAVGAGGGGGGPVGGDFTHTPPTEQRSDTPLPIYVEGGGEVATVTVPYKAPGASAWKRLQLKKMGAGWGGLIPCADVQTGTLQYYIQGFNAAKEPIALNGSPTEPYSVSINDEISGEAPHLPGKGAPKRCHESGSDCPPDFPGCKKDSSGGSEDQSQEQQSEDTGADGEKAAKPKGAYNKFWVGVSGTLDFQPMPSGHDLCRLVPEPAPGTTAAGTPGTPANSQNVYCTNQNGTDFPTRQDGGAVNGQLVPGQSGESGGGLQRGEARVMLSFDYALNANLLVGARVGISFFTYPGQAAYDDGHAYKFANSRLYWDARGTYLIGENALAKTIAPMVFAGIGMASFDTSTSSVITLNDGTSGRVNMWQNNGPFFFLVGGGAHFLIVDSFGGTIGVRFNGSFGTNGFIPTFGPELGLQYGF